MDQLRRFYLTISRTKFVDLTIRSINWNNHLDSAIFFFIKPTNNESTMII